MFQEVQPYKDSLIMRKDPYGNYITCLTGKQYRQLKSISEKVQPYLPFTEVAFLELVKMASSVIFNKGFNNSDLSVRSGLVRFKNKFYMNVLWKPRERSGRNIN